MATISRWRAKRISGEYLTDEDLEAEAAEMAALEAEDAAYRAQLSPEELAALEAEDAAFDAACASFMAPYEPVVFPTNPIDQTPPPPIPTVPPPPAPEGFAYRFFSMGPTVMDFGDLIPIEEVRHGEAVLAARLKQKTELMSALCDAALAECEPEPPPKKRRKLTSPVAKRLAPIARKLKKSKHAFLQLDADIIDVLISGKPLDVDAALVERIMTGLGGALPAETWQAVLDFAGVSLATVFADAARTERARLAFTKGQRKKTKWVAKKDTERKTKNAADRAWRLAALKRRGL